MFKEVKILFENIIHFRQLLKENVGQSSIVDAIQKHKIIYIYYEGDDKEGKGYRTIKPMVLGYSINNPYMLLRAWEVAGSSYSKKKYVDEKNRLQYGWRLFNVDKITSFLPAGKFFRPDMFSKEMIEDYNPNDSQMRDIISAVQIDTQKTKTNKKGSTVGQKIEEPPSAFDGQKDKFQYFSKAGKKQRDVTAHEIEHLWAIADQIKKKSRSKMMVVTDEHGDMILKDESLRSKYPPEAIVGNLKDLYVDLVLKDQPVDNSFFNKQRNGNNLKENSQRKTFFK
jgi:hypothetical protein